jgi:uncharacterized membrane protein YjfL (UPF0719 family)
MLKTLGEDLGLVVVLVALLFFGKVILDLLVHWLHGYNADHELSESDNPAFGLSFFGFLIGIAIATLSGVTRTEMPYYTNIAMMLAHGGFAIVALIVAWIVNDKCVLYRISNAKAIFGGRNIAVGMVESGSYVASALVLAGSWSSGGWGSVILWFVIGQALFVIVTMLYQWITPYDIHAEIEAGNMACAIGFSGFLIATGILIGKAVSGPSNQLGADLRDASLYLILGIVMLVLIRLAIGRVFLRTSRLNQEIATDRNPNAGLAEAVIYGITALAFTTLL